MIPSSLNRFLNLNLIDHAGFDFDESYYPKPLIKRLATPGIVAD
jgi:hypothetical protein